MMTFDYSGKSVLVTGAARGLGYEIARTFHEAGATVYLNDRTEERVEYAIARAGGGPRFIAAPADLATAEGATEATAPARRRGRLDIIVNNAAVNTKGRSPRPMMRIGIS